MKISEIAVALTNHYREHKKANGGHKTSPNGKYGFKTIRYFVQGTQGPFEGPFLGRGSALTAFKNSFKLAGKKLDGVRFVVETIFVPKDKSKELVIEKTDIFTLTVEPKEEKVVKKVLTEQEQIEEALKANGFVKAKAARQLGISADVITNRIKKYGIALTA